MVKLYQLALRSLKLANLVSSSGTWRLEPWHEIKGANTNEVSWSVRIKEGPARIGVQIHALPGAEMVDPYVELGGQRWTWQGKLTAGQFVFFWPGEPPAS